MGEYSPGSWMSESWFRAPIVELPDTTAATVDWRRYELGSAKRDGCETAADVCRWLRAVNAEAEVDCCCC